MKNFLKTIDKVYCFNFAIIATLMLTILTTFLVQFKVESLQEIVAKTENEILFYQDKIESLEIEWVYLTRPQRLKELTAKYLISNSHVKTAQVKNFDKLEDYYLANYNKYLSQELAMK